MCQLTLINLKNKRINKLALLIFSVLNTQVNHQDGWGFFNKSTGIYKTRLCPKMISNIHTVINDSIIDSSLIINHVRQASVGSIISEKNSHPFEGERFILAHNGTLSEVEYKVHKKDIIDSEIFLLELEKVAEENPKLDFIDCFNTTMEEFVGKFAFLIFDKIKNKYYIIRGKTADLYQAKVSIEGRQIGIIINTERDSLEKGLRLLKDTLFLTSGDLITFSESEILPEESIFEVDGINLRVIGKTTENVRKYITVIHRTIASVASSSDRYINIITDFMKTFGLSLFEVNIILKETLGCSLVSCNETDLDTFAKYIRPKFVIAKLLRKKIKSFLEEHKEFPLSFYIANDLQFPYMMNPGEKLEKAFDSFILEFEEKSK